MAAIVGRFSTAIASAQDLSLHVNHGCTGPRVYIENCYIRDLPDAASPASLRVPVK